MMLALFVKIDDISSLLRGVALVVHLSESLVTHDCVEQFEARKIGDTLLLFTNFVKGTTADQARGTLKTEYEAFARKSGMPYSEAADLLASLDRIAETDGEEVIARAAQFVAAKSGHEPESTPPQAPQVSPVDRSKMN